MLGLGYFSVSSEICADTMWQASAVTVSLQMLWNGNKIPHQLEQTLPLFIRNHNLWLFFWTQAFFIEPPLRTWNCNPPHTHPRSPPKPIKAVMESSTSWSTFLFSRQTSVHGNHTVPFPCSLAGVGRGGLAGWRSRAARLHLPRGPEAPGALGS